MGLGVRLFCVQPTFVNFWWYKIDTNVTTSRSSVFPKLEARFCHKVFLIYKTIIYISWEQIYTTTDLHIKKIWPVHIYDSHYTMYCYWKFVFMVYIWMLSIINEHRLSVIVFALSYPQEWRDKKTYFCPQTWWKWNPVENKK